MGNGYYAYTFGKDKALFNGQQLVDDVMYVWATYIYYLQVEICVPCWFLKSSWLRGLCVDDYFVCSNDKKFMGPHCRAGCMYFYLDDKVDFEGIGIVTKYSLVNGGLGLYIGSQWMNGQDSFCLSKDLWVECSITYIKLNLY